MSQVDISTNNDVDYVTPVVFGKMIGVLPQIVYNYIKTGLPVHAVEFNGKVRQMVNPAEALVWVEGYKATKRTRRTKEEIEIADKNKQALIDAGEPVSGKNIVSHRPNIQPKQLITYMRQGKHVHVAEVESVGDYYTEMHKHINSLWFTLQDTKKESFPLLHETLTQKLRKQEILLDTPLQVLKMALISLNHLDPEFFGDIQESVSNWTRDKHTLLDAQESLVETQENHEE